MKYASAWPSAILFAGLWFAWGCKPESKPVEYKNKSHYEVHKGEKFEIYFVENSCCENCVFNSDSLKSVRLLESIVVQDYPDDCDGCDRTGAFVFEAVAEGTDTILLNMREASASCYELDGEPEKYVVTVRSAAEVR